MHCSAAAYKLNSALYAAPSPSDAAIEMGCSCSLQQFDNILTIMLGFIFKMTMVDCNEAHSVKYSVQM